MLSTCPNCLSQINHADHLFDVTCECGAHFSPYLNVEDPNSNSFSKYAESDSAFKEIVQFGEGMGTVANPPSEAGLSSIAVSEPSLKPAPPPLEKTKPVASLAKEMLMTTAAELSGYVIQIHFAPISVVAPFQSNASNPIQTGTLNLWKTVESLGANGLVGLQTSITPDAQNILLIGIPVRCTKVV